MACQAILFVMRHEGRRRKAILRCWFAVRRFKRLSGFGLRGSVLTLPVELATLSELSETP